MKLQTFATLAVLAAAATAPALLKAGDGDFGRQLQAVQAEAARGPAGIKDWFKTPADKATAADKLEFMKAEGQNVDGLFYKEGAAVILTEQGEAVFARMKNAYNDQLRLSESGYQRIAPEQARALEDIERVVNMRIVRMREQCKDMERMMNGNVVSFSCGFITEADYVRKSGRGAFASPEGQRLLEIISHK